MNKDPEVEALLRTQWAEALEGLIYREAAMRMRVFSKTSDTSRTQKYLSLDGLFIDLAQTERGPLMRSVTGAQEAGRKLQGLRYGRRDAHATLALYREEMAKRLLPLLDDISKMLRDP